MGSQDTVMEVMNTALNVETAEPGGKAKVEVEAKVTE